MSVKFRSALAHGLMAYLLSLGMTLTALGVTGLLQDGGLAAALLAVLAGAFAVAGMDRRVALGAGCLAAFAVAVWLVIGGAGVCTEVFRALILHMSGLTTALPMVHMPFTVLVCVLTLAASWFVTQRSAGAYPALILLVLIAVLLWLGDWPEVLPCLLPAALCCVTLLLRAGDENTSTLRVLPLAAVVTGLAFACTAMGGATFRPLKDFADNLRQRIYDTLFYTQPRDVFTLATEGYYPQGMSQLGGPAAPREEPVMAVITPKKAYLRGVVKNVYTGRVWLDDIGGRRYLWSSSRFEDIRTSTFDMDVPTLDASADSTLLTPTLLQVRMLGDSASTMFVPQRLKALESEGELIPYFNRSSEVFATANLQAGDVWTMEAALFTSMDAGAASLVKASDDPTDARWQEVCDTYLQLPEHLQAEVYDIAAQATAGASTPYDKAIALQSYLAANYAYNLDVPEQNPEQDFVSTFLLLGKEGYCTYFASAMTVLCRMAGLPARYVEGYVAYPDEEGLAFVTGLDGHAWSEVYFRGFGWVTFDATPTSAEYTDYSPEDQLGGESDEPESTPEPSTEPTASPAPLDEEELDLPTPTPEPESAEKPDVEPAESPSPEDGGFFWGWLIWLALLAAAVRLVLTQPAVQARMKKTEFARWMVWAQAAHDALRRQGFVRGKNEAITAFFGRVAASGQVRVPLEALAQAENLMFYGHAAPYAEETAQARATFRALYKGLTLWQKALFHLRRGLPAKAFTK